MTLADLNEHLALRQDLEKIREREAYLRAAAGPGASTLTGMPHAPGYKDKVGDLAAEIADLDAMAQEVEEEIRQSEDRVTGFIAGIDNVYTRILFRLRFVRGLSWEEVAEVGGYMSDDAAKSTCYRFFSDRKKKSEK